MGCALRNRIAFAAVVKLIAACRAARSPAKNTPQSASNSRSRPSVGIPVERMNRRERRDSETTDAPSASTGTRAAQTKTGRESPQCERGQRPRHAMECGRGLGHVAQPHEHRIGRCRDRPQHHAGCRERRKCSKLRHALARHLCPGSGSSVSGREILQFAVPIALRIPGQMRLRTCPPTRLCAPTTRTCHRRKPGIDYLHSQGTVSRRHSARPKVCTNPAHSQGSERDTTGERSSAAGACERTRRPHAGLVHAPGRTLSPRVSGRHGRAPAASLRCAALRSSRAK